MSPDPASINHDAQQAALKAARLELMAAFYAKQEADRRYLEAFASYEEAANTLRRTLTVVEPSMPRAVPRDCLSDTIILRWRTVAIVPPPSPRQS